MRARHSTLSKIGSLFRPVIGTQQLSCCAGCGLYVWLKVGEPACGGCARDMTSESPRHRPPAGNGRARVTIA